MADTLSPFFFCDYVDKCLSVSLDNGISEYEFYNMTFAELDRALQSKRRVEKRKLQEKASFDYILADMIGRSVSRVYNSANRMPDIAEVYPTLFDSEEIKVQKQEKKNELSVLRFKLFADSYNKNYQGEAKDK